MGEGRSFAHVALEMAQSATTQLTPMIGNTSQSIRLTKGALIRLAFHVVDRESFRVSLQVTSGIERGTVEKGLLVMANPGMGEPNFLHCFLINVRTHYRFGDSVVIRSAGDHSPAPELRQPPLAVFRLGIIAIALA